MEKKSDFMVRAKISNYTFDSIPLLHGTARQMLELQSWNEVARTDLLSHTAPSANGTPNLITEPSPVRHATVRRVFSPAFSEKALKQQEPLFQHYADLMVARGRKKGTVNMAELLNWTTFDIMAEFAFGESLGLLEKEAYSEWVSTVFNTLIVCASNSHVRLSALIALPGPPCSPND